MPETNENDAWWCLERGALGIGEDHTQPGGRQLAIDLIESGLVNHLFVELANVHFGATLQNAQQIAANGGAFANVQLAAPNGNLFQCAIPLSRVIATALTNGVTVHLADHAVMAVHANRFQQRHNNIRTVFSQATGQLAPPVNAVGGPCVGCLLLWGGAHFEGNHALDRYIIGLPFIMMG